MTLIILANGRQTLYNMAMSELLINKDVAERLVCKGDVVAVAVSGGKDSIALLDWFNDSAADLGAEFFAVNVEHGIRGAASVADSEFVKDFCESRGIRFMGYVADVPSLARANGKTVEQQARDCRYAVFKELADRKMCTKIATAHHMDDNAETILMRILRGTGLKGLAGISEQREGIYIRPLLKVSRAAIEEYVAARGLPFREDETNKDNMYRRNFLRNQVIPLIKTQYPEAEKSIVRLAEIAAESERYLKSKTPPVFGDGKTAYLIVNGQEPLILKRQIAECFERLGIYSDIEQRHLDLVADLVGAENGTRLDMPWETVAYKEYEKIVIAKAREKQKDYVKLTLPFRGAVAGKTLTVLPYDGRKPKKGQLVINADKLPEGAVLRCRRDGDVFTKFGGGTKSLGDFLTDKKIPLRLRDELVVCAKDNVVYFIAGVEISSSVKADSLASTNENLYIISTED